MSFSCSSSYFHFPSTFQRNLSVRSRRTILHRRWKHRKLKRNHHHTVLAIRNLNPMPLENLFQNIVSQFPSVNSLDLIAPALGFISGFALHLSQSQKSVKLLETSVSDLGEWILFTSPTPFNRFVVLRCPSISFRDSELMEEVNERLVTEDRHFVRLNSGKIQVRDDYESTCDDEKLVYQRVCLSTEDGGVVSLDWPANLDLEEEYGLDSAIVIVPGTTEGSMNKNIRAFVVESLRRGCFPLVMNPRGCAGSPLTTARLFTAADSDDISTAVQFINKKRPWSTIMSVGWGYGANMLTKYLAEVGEKTPLTAATCINNPFDLEEATRATPCHIAVDQKLTRGLVDILQSNKELFQGHGKGFDVENALFATSVRDFEKAISMVSYGFNSIEDFYAKSSTRDVVGKVKIPLLFIQSDEGSVPLFSVPRSSIAENPYTSLLLCSYFPHDETTNGRSTLTWCQHLTIEWLTAAELGLLKGRHPLLKDVDVTINPSKGLTLVREPSYPSFRSNKLLDLPNSDALDGYSLDPSLQIFEGGDTAARFGRDSGKELRSTEKLQETFSTLQNGSAADAESGGEEAGSPVDGERGMLQAAELVMNMLDVTMPDTLTEEQKKKVLTAVGQGETIMKALQDAVPDDVRGKLTTAVSGILHNHGSNLKIDGLLNLGHIPNLTSRVKSKIEKDGGFSSIEGGSETPHLSDGKKRAGDFSEEFNNDGSSTEKHSQDLVSEPELLENAQKSVDTSQSQEMSSHGSEVPALDKKDRNDVESNQSANLSEENTALTSDYRENESKAGAKLESSSAPEVDGGTEKVIAEQSKVQHDGGKRQADLKEEISTQQKEEKNDDISSDPNKETSATQTEDNISFAASPSETNVLENEVSDTVKREERSMQTESNQIIPNAPSFDVSQALDTLTGIDDSTQVAVNSVFHVLEDMITQLEGERNKESEINNGDDKDGLKKSEIKNGDGENGLKDRDKVLDQNTSSISNNHPTVDNQELDDVEKSKVCSPSQEKYRTDATVFGEVQSDTVNFQEISGESHAESDQRRKKIVNGDPAVDSLRSLDYIQKTVPVYMSINSYGDPLYKEYLRNYLSSKTVITKPLDLDTTTALFLDYFPEEGQWKLLEQTGSNSDLADEVAGDDRIHVEMQHDSLRETTNMDNVIEPSYVIFDNEIQDPDEECVTLNNSNENVEVDNDTANGSALFFRNIIVDAIKVEVGRKVSAADMKEMQPKLFSELEHVANAISQAVGHGEELVSFIKSKNRTSEKVGTLQAEHIVHAISSAVQGTSYLRRVLPVGVIVGCSLAALRKFFDVDAVDSSGQSKELVLDEISELGKVNSIQTDNKQIDEKHPDKQVYGLQSPLCQVEGAADSENSDRKYIMVGAVTAALGASAFLVHQQDAETFANSPKPFEDEKNQSKEVGKLDEESNDKSHNNIVTSLAEKAMSVAGPVVPMKKDGAVDQERLVAMLAELGQKGGILKLVAKVALLWGGVRGAINLTDKLISFLRIAERPLAQRILAFAGMVLVLWSPVVVPLLLTLVQRWTTQKPSRTAELVCIVGLYMSIFLLVTLWGKRIRGYENPLEQYGLDMTSMQKGQNYLKGLFGGIVLVLLIHSVNSLIGCAHFCLPVAPPTSSAALTWLKVYGRMFVLFVQGLATATGIATVEELLFRSWLLDEIAVDLGYYRGIIVSGLAFALFQRSPWAVPGLWLLSLTLAGVRQRSQGSLFLPIGLRSGILASSYILHTGGFLTYQPKFPPWFTGSYPAQPFSGVVGFAFALSLAILLYPGEPLRRKNTARKIKE
ncbi:uncharacterized protein LOC107789128 isoform X1 [Nicotiana tabacum]|uniref:Uncharacterized protein LOC107789128 isoform X1 n=3 Tax=Nicotiana tabacum TaxID=4097 RepID=A0A1S3ZPU8_TOBAC|nr:PREDICTED: uncharacterized protein LOC107789128 isoform X1 [Nicotiana tabacum]